MFLLYWFKSPIGQYELLKNESQVGVPSISTPLKSLKEVTVVLPSLTEQNEIASVLSSLDDKIDLLHRQNKTLEEMAETLFRQWFVEEAEDSWGDSEVGSICQSVTKSIRPSKIDDDLPYVALENIQRKNIALLTFSNAASIESNKYLFRKWDILFGKLRPYFHKVTIAPCEGVCSTDILVIRPNEYSHLSFCLFLLYQDEVIEYTNISSGGTRMPRTSWEILSKYLFKLPPRERIVEFNEMTLPSIEKIFMNLKEIDYLSKMRDTLLPKLMSCEITVA